ncbi:MAG: glycosyltransferase [Verrucomicrobium sp.]|nr:glycosyltransferase [Verrucomicrobium sp.]
MELNKTPASGTGENTSDMDIRPRMLWINCRLLHPLIGGDRLRTYHMLRRLKAEYHITYVCPRTLADGDEALEGAAEYSDDLVTMPHHFSARGSFAYAWGALTNSAWGSLPFMAKRYESAEFQSWLESHASNDEFDLIVCDYLVSSVHLFGPKWRPKAPVVVFQHNVESLIWERHAANATHPVKRWIFHRETMLTRHLEQRCAERVAGQITVSPEETTHFRDIRGMRNVLGDVPTGVDASYFKPAKNPEPHTLAFLGSMDWEANCQAVRAFLKNSFPSILEQFPKAKLLVIGRNPPADLREASAGNPSVVVTGTVPDVRPYLEQASIMILPLLVGGGTRVKVYEAMAAGLAVISTAIGVEGLPVAHGEHAFLAEMEEPFTEGVLTLLRDPELRSSIARNGRELVETQFSWEAAANKFSQLCRPLLEKKL